MARQNIETTDTLDQGRQKINANDVEEYAHIASTSNPHSVTKAQVGLGNADDTSDITKALTLESTAKTTDFTFALADVNVVTRFNSATPIVGTIPLNATVAFPVGSNLELSSIGAGAATIAATGGVTLTSSSGNFIIPANNIALLRKTATDTWKLYNGAPPLTWTPLTMVQTGLASGITSDIRYIIDGKKGSIQGYFEGTGNTLDSVTITNLPGIVRVTTYRQFRGLSGSSPFIGQILLTGGGTSMEFTIAQGILPTGAWPDNGYRLAYFSFDWEIA